MTTKELDRLARGPRPRDRVPVPAPGERCSRCHTPTGRTVTEIALDVAGKLTIVTGQRPCLLCCPELVPVEFGGMLVTPQG